MEIIESLIVLKKINEPSIVFKEINELLIVFREKMRFWLFFWMNFGFVFKEIDSNCF